MMVENQLFLFHLLHQRKVSVSYKVNLYEISLLVYLEEPVAESKPKKTFLSRLKKLVS